MHKAQIVIHDPAGKLLYDRVHTAPASWTEMSGKHLLLWASAMGSSLKLGDARLNLAAMWYDLPKDLFNCFPKRELRELAESIDFLFKRNRLSKWAIPSIWRGVFKYYGPKNQLANVTIHEFDRCEYCYERYQQTHKIEYLETLAAILYRPQRFWGIDDDIRVPLTVHGYTKRALHFKKLPAGLKYAIYLNYEGCRNFLHEKYRDVFQRGSVMPGKTVKLTVTPWPKIVESGANDIFGYLDTTKKTNLHEFLSRLGTRIREGEEMKRAANKK